MASFTIPEDLKPVVAFHGHICPGLIIGYRAAKLAAKELELHRDKDEELVAVVENDACGVDAIQSMLGCSIGKGNLIFRDQGKQAFTIFRRDTGKAVRLVFQGQAGASSPEGMALRKKVMTGAATADEQALFEVQKTERMRQMLTAPDAELFSVKAPTFACRSGPGFLTPMPVSLAVKLRWNHGFAWSTAKKSVWPVPSRINAVGNF